MAPAYFWSCMLFAVSSNAIRFPRQAFVNSSALSTTATQSQTLLDTVSASTQLSASHTDALISTSLTSTIPISVTSSPNATSTSNTTSTTPTSGTCCYVRPNAVGINSWYSKAMEVPVATVITTWVQHGNGTAVPQNSTTITAANTTAPYGWYSWMTGEPSTQWSVTTITGGTYYTTTMSVPTETIYQPATSTSRFSGVPNTLLPVNALMYASSQVLSATTMAYELQQMTFTSPTPYLWFSQMWIATSKPCETSYRGAGGEEPIMATSTIVMPLPSAIANADFTFEQYMILANMTDEGDGSSTYSFSLPEDLPQFLAGIPEIVESYPFVGSCTNGPGAGEPTVHIPVSQLTASRDVTMTLPGTITSADADAPTTTAGRQPSPSTRLSKPVVEATQTSLQVPTRPSGTALPAVTDDDTPEPSPTQLPEEDDTPGSTPTQLPEEDDTPEPSPTQQPGQDNTPNTTPTPPGQDDDDDSDTSQPTSPDGAAEPSAPAPGLGDIIASVIGLVPTAGTTAVQPRPSPDASPSQPEEQGGSAGSQVNDDLPQVTPGAEVIVGGDTISANPDGNFVIGTETLQPGDAPITVGGNTISLAPSATAIIINEATTPLAAPAAQVSLGNGVLTADPLGNFEVGGHTLQPGGVPITIGGTVLSLAPSGTALVVDGSSTIPALPPAAADITVARSTLTANEEGAFVIGGQTLPSGSAVTVDGSTFSLASNGDAIVVNGQTSPIAAADAPQITVDGAVVTADSNGAFAVGSTTLSQGAAVTLAGTTYSLASDGSNIVVDGTTRSIEVPSNIITAAPESAGAGVVTAGGSTLSFIGLSSEVVIGGQTLSIDASTAVIDGQTLSLLNPSQIVVISGTSTRTLDLMATTTVIVTRTRTTSSSGDEPSDGTTTALLVTATGAAERTSLGKSSLWTVSLTVVVVVISLL
ncbi:hypothetical protein Slin14017_G017800 [Septoria linicola]|nr:hypothetical protein Slin14017_G017800 [Septoria linicola]